MSNEFSGSCLCGEVKYTLSGSVQSFFLCHCTRCQKGSGSSNAANLFSRQGTLSWLKGEDKLTTYRHPNTLHTRCFCQTCGSALPYYLSSIESVVVPAGSLDSYCDLIPTAKIFMAERAAWFKKLNNIACFDTLP